MAETVVDPATGYDVLLKDHLGLVDFAFDTSEWLAPMNDTLTGTPTVVPDDPALDISAVGIVDNDIVFWADGGVDGTDYQVRADWQTVGGRRYGQTGIIRVVVK